jgi:hypothetical protein
VRDWDSVLKKGTFGSFDSDVTIPVSSVDIREKKRVVWDFDRDCRVGEGEARPGFGGSVEVGGLWGEEEGGSTCRGWLLGKRRRWRGRGGEIVVY